ncbi:uncharacterized protein [Dermacentor andersoni]|uniref:uncharacterized protein n=1 Tax=Dermacentor andersoni TaxID=34620 RepID=UPI00241716B2|nr:uncharacterized protein LOC129381044 [Dermacentor andersoni]
MGSELLVKVEADCDSLRNALTLPLEDSTPTWLATCVNSSPYKQLRAVAEMFSAKSVQSSPATSLFLLAILLCAWATTPCLGGAEASASSSETGWSEASYVQRLKDWIANAMDRVPPTLMRKFLEADVSTECSLGLLKMMRGFRNLEPWALRLIDASGKYPTGAFQLSRADMGAFDQCVETALFNDYGEETVRGQYCNLLVYHGNKTDLDDLISLAMQFAHPRVRQRFDQCICLIS